MAALKQRERERERVNERINIGLDVQMRRPVNNEQSRLLSRSSDKIFDIIGNSLYYAAYRIVRKTDEMKMTMLILAVLITAAGKCCVKCTCMYMYLPVR